ncbi:MAG: PEP-CTERM sorting domain-containing protein [Thermodesulfobacteriota bacterium]|nr:PEP-CTERM sorting domain-containing protein [Thermodesulfobacteriota bacterium]
MKSLKVISVSVIVLFFLAVSPVFALPTQTIGTGSSVSTIDRSAEFDSIVTYTSLDGYAEDNLRISTTNYAYVDYHSGAYFPSIPPSHPGFSNGFFYPSGGVYDYISIKSTDGAQLFGLEFYVGSGWSSDSDAYIRWEIYDNSILTGLGTFTVGKGTVVGFNDPNDFTELRIGAAASLSEAGNNFSLFNNALAMDNLVADLSGGGPPPIPEPATIFLLGSGLFGLAGLRRKFKK